MMRKGSNKPWLLKVWLYAIASVLLAVALAPWPGIVVYFIIPVRGAFEYGGD
jgi:hypothetical protein